MIISLRSGHNPNCFGAIGNINEALEMRKFYYEVEKILVAAGHKVINCNSENRDKDIELHEGVNISNKYNNVDIFISLHMNKHKGAAHGVEAWTWGSTSRANNIAAKLCQNFSKYLGFYNRGLKYKNTWLEMKAVKAPNIILETCFCDNDNDCNKWNSYSLEYKARVLCNAIDSNIPIKESNNNNNNNAGVETFYRVVCGSFKNMDNAITRQNLLQEKGFKDVFIDVYKK